MGYSPHSSVNLPHDECQMLCGTLPDGFMAQYHRNRCQDWRLGVTFCIVQMKNCFLAMQELGG